MKGQETDFPHLLLFLQKMKKIVSIEDFFLYLRSDSGCGAVG